MSTVDLHRLENDSFLRRVEWHEALPSTNDRALELAARESLDTPLLVGADAQTAGRGRGANRWWSSHGALTFSLILDPQADRCAVGPADLPVTAWPRVALTAGLSLCEVLQTLVPHVASGLKWPNDVLVAGKKAAGILVEVPPASTALARRLVLGMGINVNNSLAEAPEEIRAAGTALCDAAGLEFDLTELLLAWLHRFAANLQALAAGDRKLSARWKSLCALSGRTVELHSGDRPIRGRCHGIDSDGALVVETASGRERLYGGVLVRIGS